MYSEIYMQFNKKKCMYVKYNIYHTCHFNKRMKSESVNTYYIVSFM